MDLISRKEAIDALWKPTINPDAEIFHALRAAQQSLIEQLPSAEPEIIYCAECKYYTKEIGWNGSKHMVCSDAGRYQSLVSADDFCSRAERRTDE